jgi:hypothetical protein
LPQQRFRFDVTDLERAEQLFGRGEPGEIRRKKSPLSQQFDEERGCAGLEPVRLELSLLEQQQQVERVVHGLARPVVAVVPAPDAVAVASR